MSQHLPQILEKNPEEHKIQTNLNAAQQAKKKQTAGQNKHRDQDKHQEIHILQENQNEKIQQQPFKSQINKQQYKKEQLHDGHLQLTLQQRVDIVQLSPNAQKIQQPKIQPTQDLPQINIQKEQIETVFPDEFKSYNQIQQPKENEYKVQVQNQPRQTNQVNIDQQKNKLNGEAMQEAIKNKAKQQLIVDKEYNQLTEQLKKSQEECSVDVHEKEDIATQQKQKQKKHLPNKQNLGQQKMNIIVPQQQLKIQMVQIISQETKLNNIDPAPPVNTLTPKIEHPKSNQKIQNVIYQSETSSKNLQNKVQVSKEHKYQQPKVQNIKVEANDSKNIQEGKQGKPNIELTIFSVSVQQFEAHEELKNQIQPHEIVQDKSHSQETSVVQETKKQQSKVSFSKQNHLKEQVSQYHQIILQQNIDNQNSNVIKKQVLNGSNHITQQPQIKQIQQKNEAKNIVVQHADNTYNQIKQNISGPKEIQLQRQEQQQITIKQKIRVNTEYIQSVADDNKQKDKKVIQFTQYVPTEHNENVHSQLQDIDNTNKVVLKTEVFPQKTIILQQQELKPTYHPSYQSIEPKPLSKMKPAQIAHNIVESRQSPKKQFGKITKRTLYDKKVHEIVRELSKYDEKKTPIPVLQPVKKSDKKLMDFSKLDTHIALKSNVMNLTIGELISDDSQLQSSEKLLAEIELLKKKLSELQRKKEERIKKQRQQQSESPQKSESNAENLKFSKKHYTGRIIKKVEQAHSRVSEQIKPLVSSKKSETIAIEPATISSASKNRNTLGLQTQQQLDQLPQTDMSKTMAINFRVRRPSKNSQGFSQFQSNQKESAKKNRQRLDSDKCFQTTRRQQVFEKLEFTQEESLTVIEKPFERELKYEIQFREYVEKYFIQIGKQVPLKQMEQQQFVELAKKTFRKFGVNLQAQRSAALSVKKYKNCISFILDTNRTIIWYYEGKFYFGGWTINQVGEGQKQGWGYEYVPGKYVYSGTFKDNKRNGYGIIKFLSRQNDTVYQGNWSNGFKQGLGKQLEPDGVEYIGSWNQGKKHGYGILRISQCDYYSGYFILGIKNGEGTQVFKNGDRYVGSYKDGKFQGKGTYTWSNYSKYQGDFVEGIRNGYGFWIANYLDQASDRYEGQYKNDKKNGYGVYKWKDGTIYQGQFLNDLKHGEGTVSYTDGRKATLQWLEGSIALRPTVQKPQRNNLKRGNSSRAGSQKSESRSRRFDAKLNLQNKSKGKKVFN